MGEHCSAKLQQTRRVLRVRARGSQSALEDRALQRAQGEGRRPAEWGPDDSSPRQRAPCRGSDLPPGAGRRAQTGGLQDLGARGHHGDAEEDHRERRARAQQS